MLDAESLLMEAIDAHKNDEVEDTVEVGFSVHYLYTKMDIITVTELA